MQQFTAILKKEFCGYFKNNFAYFIFFIYLFSSIGAAFYFGSYLAARDSSLFSLFYLQPVILAVLSPAVTMRIWSEEYKSGTAEFLLTQPIQTKILVVAKFCAVALFMILLSLFFIPFIINTSFYLHIDTSAVFCSYCGLFLLIFLYCSLGCFISSLCRNIILTYLLSVFSLILIISFPFTHIFSTYNNFLFAEISIADIFYFISFTALFLMLNVFVLECRRSAQKNKYIKFSLFCSLTFLCVILSNIIVYKLLDFKIDLTSASLYTPAHNSKQILQNINKPLTLDVFIAQDYKQKHTENFYFYEQIKRFLNRYKKMSNGLLNINFIEVEPFSELENAVLRQGIYFNTNQFDTKDYFGAVLHDNNNNNLVIKQFLPQRLNQIEKDLDKAVLKLIYPQLIKTIGVYLDPLQNIDDFNGIMLNLENDYNLFNVTANTYEISPQMDMLILINPKKLPPYFLYAIDQYIVNGGKTLIFFDYLTENQNKDINYSDIDVIKFLNNWNIKINSPLEESAELTSVFKAYNNQDIVVKKATAFSVNNLNSIDFITNNKGTIGTVIEDKLNSLYDENPFLDNEFAQDMLPHSILSIDKSTVVLIGDVDILLDQNWISPDSPDKNPYSVIPSSANGNVIRQLIDEIIGNEIYSSLPTHDDNYNFFSIGESLNKESFNKFSSELLDINHKIFALQLSLFEQSEEDVDKMKALLDTDEKGRQIVFYEDQKNLISHNIKQYYSKKIKKMIIFAVFVTPLISLLLFYIIAACLFRIQRKKIRGKIK